MTDTVNHATATSIAEATAKETIRETFRLFGVDVDDQDSVNSFRADLVHARRIRRLSERGTAAAMWGITVTLAGGALVVFWDGIRAAIGIHPS